MDDVLAGIVGRLEPELGPLSGEPLVLSGGITNRNVKVTLGSADYVLRLCGKDTAVLSIDRDVEVAATQNAYEAGVAPAVVRWMPQDGCLVTAFIEGEPISAEQLREPARLAATARALRRVHAGPPLGKAVSDVHARPRIRGRRDLSRRQRAAGRLGARPRAVGAHRRRSHGPRPRARSVSQRPADGELHR